MVKNERLIINFLTYLVALFMLPMVGIAGSSDEKDETLVQKAVQFSCDKRIVLLGELPTHGEARGFQAKAAIVQQLQEQCNFTALFFEAPMYDFLGLQKAVAKSQANPQQLDMAMGGFWTTLELREWRQWLFKQATEHGFLLAGLDDQISATSTYARSTLPLMVASAFPNQDESDCQHAIDRNLTWSYDEEHPFNQREKNLLQHCTQQAANQISINPKIAIEDRKMAENMANLYARNNNMSVAFDRDEAMFHNFDWQYERLPKNSKVIIWTATVHASREQGEFRFKPLGNWLADQWQDQMIAIGFTAFSGQSSMAGMPIQIIADAPAGSLEALVTKPTAQWQWLTNTDLHELGAVTSRLFGRFMTANWGSKFDAVVVFREEKAPTFKQQ